MSATVTVYNSTNKIVFEGTKAEARAFILKDADRMRDGAYLFRSWKEAEAHYYDVGPVYHTDVDVMGK